MGLSLCTFRSFYVPTAIFRNTEWYCTTYPWGDRSGIRVITDAGLSNRNLQALQSQTSCETPSGVSRAASRRLFETSSAVHPSAGQGPVLHVKSYCVLFRTVFSYGSDSRSHHLYALVRLSYIDSSLQFKLSHDKY